jgi:hypothetical protein
MANTEINEIDLDEEVPALPKMTCTSTKCEGNLHCFRPKKSRKRSRQPQGQAIQLLLFDELSSLHGPEEEGCCRACGKQLVDWARVHKRDLADVSYTVEIDQRALNRARRRGRAILHDEAEKIVRKNLVPASPPFDGRQTKKEGNVIFYAQHATGTCCRKCLHYWHGIEMGRELTNEKTAFVTGLIQVYIGRRLPDLPEAGEKVPYIRKMKLTPKG